MSGGDGFRVRPGCLADLEAMVALHRASFGPEQHVAVLLGTPYLRASFRAMLTSDAHFVLAAERDSRLIGFICVGPALASLRFRLALLGPVLRSLLARPSLVWSRPLWARGLAQRASTPRVLALPTVARDILNVVEESERRQGVWGALLDQATEESRRRGYRAFAAGMYQTNGVMRRSFERRDFVCCELTSGPLVWYCRPFDDELRRSLLTADS